jgi:hypothetical protein
MFFSVLIFPGGKRMLLLNWLSRRSQARNCACRSKNAITIFNNVFHQNHRPGTADNRIRYPAFGNGGRFFSKKISTRFGNRRIQQTIEKSGLQSAMLFWLFPLTRKFLE